MTSMIDNPNLAEAGRQRVCWYRERMTVLKTFRARYETEKPFLGMRLLVCMHCEPKAAVRTEVLLAGGAEEIVFIGNLGSTKADITAYLDTFPRVTVMARENDTLEDLNSYVELALQRPFDLLMDNGASLMQGLQGKPWSPLGGIEETRSGKLILEKEGINPPYPLLVIDDSPVKRLVENEAGVGQSVVDGFMRQTSMLVGGKKILILGYGFCGSGIAQRFRALGAVTMVYDTDALRMLKAKIEGHIVGKLEDLLPGADVVLTVTGRFHVLNLHHFRLMRDKTIVCNAGHYNMEIDVEELRGASENFSPVQPGIERFHFEDKDLYLLQRANPLNLSAGAGNPIEIMELGYALQLLSLEKIIQDRSLAPGVQALPEDVNQTACRLCLGL